MVCFLLILVKSVIFESVRELLRGMVDPKNKKYLKRVKRAR